MRHIDTIATAYRAICEGERPWTALGNFMNEWLDYSREQRDMLIAAPLEMPATCTDEQYRWAAFCAATVEWLCDRYNVACPAWVQQADYHLTAPWFHAFHPNVPAVRERLIQQTPEPFARRNIFCSPRAFANKYDFAASRRLATTASSPITQQ